MRPGQFVRLTAAVVLAASVVAPTTRVHALSYYDPVPGCVAHAQAYFVGPPTEPDYAEERAYWAAHCQQANWMHNGAMGATCFMVGIPGGILGLWSGASCFLIVWG